MTVVSLAAPRVLYAALARLRRALESFAPLAAPAELPLGDYRRDELRFAALQVLSHLDGDASEAAQALQYEREAAVHRAVQALESLELTSLNGASLEAVASAVSSVHAQLRASEAEDVTRALLDHTPAGAALAEVVFATDPTLLGPDTQVSFCQAAQRLESAAHARLDAAMVAFAGNNPRYTSYWVDGDECTLTDVRASELALALSWSGNKARNAVESARVLGNELDAAALAAAAGTLQPASMSAIVEGAQTLTVVIDEEIERARAALNTDTDSSDDIAQRIWELSTARDELLARYDAAVTDFATTHTLAETKRKVKHTLAKLDPEGFDSRAEKARERQSGVELRPLPDAMAMLTAIMPAEHASACYSAINGVAYDNGKSDDALPVGVRRSNALLSFCVLRGSGAAAVTSELRARGVADATASHVPLGAAQADVALNACGGQEVAQEVAPLRDDASSAASRRAIVVSTPSAHVDIVMTLDALIGLSDTPADCVGAGPIPAAAARAFLASAETVTFRRILVDAVTGHALDIGVRRYQLSAQERDYIFARDRRCRRPGCNQPAMRCECDHAVPFEDGGQSATSNLGALCVRHHQEKTHAGWTIEDSRADGACTFVSPLGRRYTHEAGAVLPWFPADG